MLLEPLLHDLRDARRALRARRGVSLLATGILALAIGATTTIFTLVYAVLLRDLPFRDPGALVVVWNRFGDAATPAASTAAATATSDRDVWLAMPEFRDLREDARTFRDVAAFTDRSLTLSSAGSIGRDGVGGDGVGGDSASRGSSNAEGAERLTALAVSSSFFPMLGVTAAIGRTIDRTDDAAGARRVVLLSHELWRNRFGGDRAIVGRAIQLDEQAYDVVGVLPAGFRIAPLSSVLPARVDAWIALEPHLPATARTERSFNMLHVVARLATGVSLTEAQSRVDALVSATAPGFPRVYRTAWRQRLVPLREQIVRPLRPVLWLLGAAVTLVMGIAVANVANLLIGQAAARRREVAIKLALGAARSRLLRQFLVESLLLAAAAGVAGGLLALWTVDLIAAWGAASLPALAGVAPDLRVLAFTIALSALSAIAFGLAPALHGLAPARRDGAALAPALFGGARAIAGERRGLRRLLVVGQVALALALIVSTLLTVQSLERLLRTDPGFAAAHRLSFRIDLPARYDTGDRRARFYERVLTMLDTLPGVRRTGATSHLPLSGGMLGSLFAVPAGQASALTSEAETFNADHRSVSASYFDTLGIPLLRGRGFSAADRREAPAVAIIDATLARRLWPDADPIGKTLLWKRSDLPLAIIGVAGAVRHRGLDRAPEPTVYRPLTQFTWPGMMLVLDADGDPAALANAARAALHGLDAGVPMAEVHTLAEVAEDTVGGPTLQARLLGSFGLLALVLALAGLYGLLAAMVAQRTPEIGVRVALGATPGDVRRLLVREGLGMTLAGIVLGVPLSIAAAPLLSTLLFGVRALDPLTYALAPALLLAAALAASLVPARRAARIDPVRALRQD